ncbi:hypothetical protein GGS26DRAFT_126605 [Hypomontagnella submonticulosa]|nr:hypothetical protein GGS26DRAFT_126605 [Hypomontagnella submonticulosa]
MARTKMTQRQLRQLRARTSWIRFHLPREQDWPTWSTAHSYMQLGPLSGVAGCEKVWLARKVEDPEEAALIVHWESADSVRDFQASPACAQLLRDLPESDVQVSLASGSLLQGLSLNDAGDASSSSSVPPRILTFQWGYRCLFEEDLNVRITTTALMIPYTGEPTPKLWWDAVREAFGRFLPKGCEDLVVHYPRPRTYQWTAWASVDSDVCQLGNRTIFCEYRRWADYHHVSGFNGATVEREEVVANSPEARESWAQTVAKAMPPVAVWEQERWDIQVATCYIPVPEDEDEEMGEEDVEHERQLEEFLKAQLESH